MSETTSLDIVSYDEAQAFLGTPDSDEDLLKALISRVSAAVEKLTGRWFIIREITEYFSADPRDAMLFLSKVPVVEDSVAVEDTIYGTDISSEANLDPDVGSLLRTYGWSPGPRRYKVTYESGYGKTPEELPGDIRQAVLEILAHKYQHRTQPGVTSETIGDYSYTLGGGADIGAGIPGSALEVLNRYRIPAF